MARWLTKDMKALDIFVHPPPAHRKVYAPLSKMSLSCCYPKVTDFEKKNHATEWKRDWGQCLKFLKINILNELSNILWISEIQSNIFSFSRCITTTEANPVKNRKIFSISRDEDFYGGWGKTFFHPAILQDIAVKPP